MSDRVLALIASPLDAAGEAPDRDYVVIDTTWTPGPGERPDLRPIRPLVDALLSERNLFDESLALIDAWAAAAGAVDRFSYRGVTWWYHARGFLRLQAHEMLLWAGLLDLLGSETGYAALEVPPRPALVAAALAGSAAAPTEVRVGRRSRRVGDSGRAVYRRARSYGVRAGRWTFDRLGLQYDPGGRLAVLDERFQRLAERPHPVLAVVRSPSFHVVHGAAGAKRTDPYVGPVLDRLEADGYPSIRVALGTTHRRDTDWAEILRDDGLIPVSYVARRFATPESLGLRNPVGRAELATVPDVDLPVGRHNLGPALSGIVRGLGWWVMKQRREMVLAEQLIQRLRPAVVFTGWEGARTSWLGAAAHTGVPSAAIQHGVIYPNNPEYIRGPHPNLVRPSLTCVFGTYERRILTELGRYDPDRVVVTGSPRAVPVHASEAMAPEDRQAIRAQLGVRTGDRLLVVSGARNPVGEEFHTVSMVSRVLDGPLPDVHVVFKLHPEETEGSHYLALLDGLARAGGYAPIRASVVRDIDVYRLLLAADAHLGQYSTVLTDAVVTGTPNMIAVGQAWADVIGHVAANVATPVRNVDDVRAFMAEPRRAEPTSRARFLADRFAPGDAVANVATAIRSLMDGPGPAS